MGEGTPGNNELPQKTPAEIQKIRQKRMASDSEALEGGAELSPEDKVKHSPEQIEAARREMETKLQADTGAARERAAEARGQEKGSQLEQKVGEIERIVSDAAGTYNMVVSRLSQLKSGMLGGIDASDSQNKRFLEEIVASGNAANANLYDLERRSPRAGPGTKMRVPNFEELKNTLEKGGKISTASVTMLREQLLANAGLLEMMGDTLRSLREAK